MKKKPINRFIYWTPRILSIIFLVFLALMSLDIFSMNLGFLGTILGLFMHNIPALFLLVILLISWKHEIVGGIVFILAGLIYIIMVIRTPLEWYITLSWSLTIAGPAFLIGILFIVNWIMKKKILG